MVTWYYTHHIHRTMARNYQRDGPMMVDGNQEGCPNYFPNSFSGPKDDVRKYSESKYTAPSADVGRFNSADEDNFTQCGIFFRNVLNFEEKKRLVDNIASHVVNAQEFLQVCLLSTRRRCFCLQNDCSAPLVAKICTKTIYFYRKEL